MRRDPPDGQSPPSLRHQLADHLGTSSNEIIESLSIPFFVLPKAIPAHNITSLPHVERNFPSKPERRIQGETPSDQTSMTSKTDWPSTKREKRILHNPGSWHNPTGELIRPLANDVWVVERGYVDLTCMDVGGKMTIIRFGENRLLIHSALPLTPELKNAIDALGTVAVILASNDQHVDFVGIWKKHYPAAVAISPPRMKARRQDIPFDEEIHPVEGHVLLKDAGLEHVYVGGVPFMNESVFFHAASKILLTTDIVFPFPVEKMAWYRGLMYKGLEWLMWALYHGLAVRDKRSHRESIERIESWDFETLIPTHGDIITENAKDMLRKWQAYK